VSKKRTTLRVLDEYGTTFSEELGIELTKNTPSELFRWLTFSLLASARIGWEQAMKATDALREAGWTTAEKMARATWEQRVRVLNEHGYARYDESTSRMLQDASDLLLDEYGGDLRRLREAAGRDPKNERKRLKELKGVGDVGVDIFFREAQAAWAELRPFADERALKAAKRLGLGDSAEELAELVSEKEFPRLVAGLVRVELEDGDERVDDAR
jgi:endonuclease III